MWTPMGDPAGETVDGTAANVKPQGNTCIKRKKYGKYGRMVLSRLRVQEQPPQDTHQSREEKDDGHPLGESRSTQLAGEC